MEGSTPENSSASSTNKTAETKITKNGNTEIEITVTTTIETEITGTTIAEDEIPKNEIPETETLKETPENIPNIANKLREAQIVFVIGGPGVGKATQCKRLAEDLDIVHVSVGDLLRAKAASSEGQGLSITEIMRKGGLVSPEEVQKILCNFLAERVREGKTRFLVDGFPRSVEQAKLWKAQGLDPKAVLHFDCPKETMLDRVLRRGKNSGRVDDNKETFEKRYDAQFVDNLAIKGFYGEKVQEVDCAGELHEIYNVLKVNVEAVYGMESKCEVQGYGGVG